MFVVDLPNVSVQADAAMQEQIVAAQQLTPMQLPLPNIKFEQIVTAPCHDVENWLNPEGSNAGNQLTPLGELFIYFKWPLTGKENFDNVTSGILEPAKHGVAIPDSNASYIYRANKGYEGQDSISFWVQYQGKYYKVINNLAVSSSIGNDDPPICESMKFGAAQK